jgi:hypothetical protein
LYLRRFRIATFLVSTNRVHGIGTAADTPWRFLLVAGASASMRTHLDVDDAYFKPERRLLGRVESRVFRHDSRQV